MPNILINKAIHLNRISIAAIQKTFYANPSQRNGRGGVYRPLACLSFALNWYIGQVKVVGYHLVNIFIHVITAWFLYLTICQLLQSPNISNRYHNKSAFVAIMGTLLWVLNPIQSQAVTYIVQRMAAMAAMFYVMAMYFYLRSKTATIFYRKIIWFAGCVVGFFFALGSKENAIMLPLSLILVEGIFYQDLNNPRMRKFFLASAIGIGCAILLMGSYIFLKREPLSFLSGYAYRSFSFSDRILTEPRIIVMYLSQLFYPIPSRLALQHDIVVSRSLIAPNTTWLSILFLCTLFGVAIARIKKNPLFSFGILFFLLNHIIESTVLPLELAFEHRNYLPSLFLFVPVAAGIKWLIEQYNNRSNLTHHMLYIFSVGLCILLMTGTYVRNLAWKNEGTLWEDTLEKAPHSARAAHNLAQWYLRRGKLDKALMLFKRAFALSPNSASPRYTSILALNGMASVLYLSGKYGESLALFKKVISQEQDFEESRRNIALVLMGLGKWREAQKHVYKLLKKFPEKDEYLYMQAAVLLHREKPASALLMLLKLLQKKSGNQEIILATAAAMKQCHKYKNAEALLQRMTHSGENNPAPLLAIIEINLLQGKNESAQNYKIELFKKFSPQTIKKALNSTGRIKGFIPIYSAAILRPYLFG